MQKKFLSLASSSSIKELHNDSKFFKKREPKYFIALAHGSHLKVVTFFSIHSLDLRHPDNYNSHRNRVTLRFTGQSVFTEFKTKVEKWSELPCLTYSLFYLITRNEATTPRSMKFQLILY